MVTADEIKELITSSRYDPVILPKLEAYVDSQASANTYDLEANLACLKLYQVLSSVLHACPAH